MGLFSKLFGKSSETETQPVQTFDVPSSASGSFHFVVDDVFTITGRGTVVTGKVDSGEVRVGDTVTINGSRPTTVQGVEMFRKALDYAQAGDNCGILLEGITRDDVHKGDVLTK